MHAGRTHGTFHDYTANGGDTVQHDQTRLVFGAGPHERGKAMHILEETGARFSDIKHDCVHISKHLRRGSNALHVENAFGRQAGFGVHIYGYMLAVSEISAYAVDGIKQLDHIVALVENIEHGHEVAIYSAAAGNHSKTKSLQFLIQKIQPVNTTEHLDWHSYNSFALTAPAMKKA